MPPVKKADNAALIVEKCQELRECWAGQPGRAKQVAEEIFELLPEPAEAE